MSETEIERLQAENARLQRQLQIAGVAQLPHADLPNRQELEELRSMVLRTYQLQLSCAPDQFEHSMRWAAFARRQPQPNSQFAPVWWLDTCREWLRLQGYPTNVSLRSVIAACVASGVAYTPLDRWPFDIEIGLTRGDAAQPSAAWRQVLESGRLPPPTPLSRPSTYPQPQAMVQPTDVRETGVRIDRS